MQAGKPLLLVFPFGYLSHYLRCLVLCRHLKDDFEISFASHALYDSFVESEGHTSFPVDSMDESGVLSSVKDFDFSWLNTDNLERCFRSQVSAIKNYRPAAVLGDANPSLKMAAGHTDVCYLSLLNGYMSKYYADTRCLSRTHPIYKYMTRLPQGMQHFLTRYGEAAALRAVHRPFRQLRARYGLPSCSYYLDELEGDYNLICDLQELFPQKALPKHYTCLGPLIYDAPSDTRVSGRLEPGKKTIFVSMGSTGDWASMSFLNASRYNRYNIVTAGDTYHVLSGTHVIHTDFVASHDLLPYTDLVICHGGNGTIYQALAYGIPILCKPVHFEQEWNVAALEKAGLGSTLDDLQLADEFAQLIEDCGQRKGEPSFSDISTRIRQSISQLKEKLEPVVNHMHVSVLELG